MSEIEKAIIIIKEEYERALKLKYVNDPIAWALYHTWRKFDVKKGNLKQ